MTRNASRDVIDEEDILVEGPPPPAFKLYSSEPKKGVPRRHDVYISTSIEEPAEYDDLCALLRSCAEGDVVQMYLNTPGGNLAAGLAIIQAMRDSPATIATILNMQAFSMGALMFLAGDKLIARPNSLLMFHDYSGSLGGRGKGNEQAASIAATNIWFESIMYDVCCPFLSRREVKSVLRGRDLWLTHEAINKRIAACQQPAAA